MQLIGFCEIEKVTKKGKIILAIPFLPKADLFIIENTKKEKDNSPDFIIFNSKIKVGAIWRNKFEKEGEQKNYFSGNIFTLILPENILRIVIFEDKNQKKGTWSGSVFWSIDKKEVDPIPEARENQSYDSTEEEDIF
jgi:uncharacterized protein (DUF736 family)